MVLETQETTEVNKNAKMAYTSFVPAKAFEEKKEDVSVLDENVTAKVAAENNNENLLNIGTTYRRNYDRFIGFATFDGNGKWTSHPILGGNSDKSPPEGSTISIFNAKTKQREDIVYHYVPIQQIKPKAEYAESEVVRFMDDKNKFNDIIVQWKYNPQTGFLQMNGIKSQVIGLDAPEIDPIDIGVGMGSAVAKVAIKQAAVVIIDELLQNTAENLATSVFGEMVEEKAKEIAELIRKNIQNQIEKK